MPIAIHPQNQVPQRVFDYIATAIRRDLLDGPDLHDLAVAVDHDEDAPAGVSPYLFVALVCLTEHYRVSAGWLISEACVCLGWPVTA